MSAWNMLVSKRYWRIFLANAAVMTLRWIAILLVGFLPLIIWDSKIGLYICGVYFVIKLMIRSAGQFENE